MVKNLYIIWKCDSWDHNFLLEVPASIPGWGQLEWQSLYYVHWTAPHFLLSISIAFHIPQPFFLWIALSCFSLPSLCMAPLLASVFSPPFPALSASTLTTLTCSYHWYSVQALVFLEKFSPKQRRRNKIMGNLITMRHVYVGKHTFAIFRGIQFA